MAVTIITDIPRSRNVDASHRKGESYGHDGRIRF